MPFGNGRGPAGMGPLTGRGAGFCAGYSVPGYVNRAAEGVSGFGRGCGRGHRNWFHSTGLFGWQRSAYGYPNIRGGAAPFAGYGGGYQAPYSYSGHSKDDHINDLKAHAGYLENMLKDIKKQIETLETETEAE